MDKLRLLASKSSTLWKFQLSMVPQDSIYPGFLLSKFLLIESHFSPFFPVFPRFYLSMDVLISGTYPWPDFFTVPLIQGSTYGEYTLYFLWFFQSHFWHQEATGNGSLESQATLGVMYEHGIGVMKNQEFSFKCFKSAAEKGNIFAMGNLALQYFRFKMFRNSFDVARRWVATFCMDLIIRVGLIRA